MYLRYFFFSGTSAYEIGSTELEAVPGYPFNFCANVSLDPAKYNNILPILSTASPDWSTVTNSDDLYANAAQTIVVGNILTICMYIAGGLRNIIPKVFWIAFQGNIHFRTNGTIYGGLINVKVPASSASICAELQVQVSKYTGEQSELISQDIWTI